MELVLDVRLTVKDKRDALRQLEAVLYLLRDLPQVGVTPVTLDDRPVDEDLDPLD